MRQSVTSSLKHMRWAIFFFPLLLMGCFDSKSSVNASAGREIKGIAALGRFFAFSYPAVGNITEEKASMATEAALGREVSFFPDTAVNAYEDAIDMPVFLGSAQTMSGAIAETPNPFVPVNRFGRANKGALNPGTAASLIFDASFSQFYSAVFGGSRGSDASTEEGEIQNPFTEARQRNDLTASIKPADQETTQHAEGPQNDNISNSDPLEAPAAGGQSDSSVIIIGDFIGSGTLAYRVATRVGDTSFISSEGRFEFNLVVNPSAIEQQRSFCIDDINGDSIPDFLSTNRNSLFGYVFLGNGNGGYYSIDRFLTGSEASIPTVGPFYNGKREILSVSTFSGIITSFHSTEGYQIVHRAELPLVPNYLLHLTSQDDAQEFLMAGQTGGARQILRWNDASQLEEVAEPMPTDPLAVQARVGALALEVYQVGSYASVVLSNGQGRSFNVANLRLYPGIYLVIGNLHDRGTLDVAIGNLIHFISNAGN